MEGEVKLRESASVESSGDPLGALEMGWPPQSCSHLPERPRPLQPSVSHLKAPVGRRGVILCEVAIF